MLARLKRKLGPLPLWAWALIAGAAVWYYRNKLSAQASSSTAADTSTLPDYGNVYGDSGSGFGGTGAGPAPGDSGGQVPLDTSGFQSALNDLTGALQTAATQLGGATSGAVDTGAGGGGGDVSGGPDAGGSGAGPTLAGVEWGGQTFTTKAALAKWLAQHGATYATWAKRHPGAAARLAGPVPGKSTPQSLAKTPRAASSRSKLRAPAFLNRATDTRLSRNSIRMTESTNAKGKLVATYYYAGGRIVQWVQGGTPYVAKKGRGAAPAPRARATRATPTTRTRPRPKPKTRRR